MLKYNFLFIYRNLIRYKGSFFINLIGLSTGLACSLLIYLWVNDELSFDKFHKKDNQLFQVMQISKENGQVIVHKNTQGPLAAAMVKDLPEVESALSVFNLDMDLQFKYGTKVIKATGLFAQKDFFKAFSFDLIQGEPMETLSSKHSIILSESVAIRLFGSAQNAIGKKIDWELGDNKQSTIVSAVFGKLPHNSSLQFDYVLTYDLLLELLPHFKEWLNEPFNTYLVLQKGTDVDKFNVKFGTYLKRYIKNPICTLQVWAYSSAYLYGKYENGIQSGGRIEYVRGFSIIAILILAIACINFMNLSTARASRRLKEVGIKKTIGATREMLIVQFLSEAVFMSFLSLILAGIIVYMLLPFFNTVTGKLLEINMTPQLLALVVGSTVLIGLFSGSYPAFYLSGFNPVSVFKGKQKNSLGELLARKGLVIFQFTISLVLIVSVIIIYRQVDYIQLKNLGYDKNNIIQFSREGPIRENTKSFLNELKQIPGIVNTAGIQESVVQSHMLSTTYDIWWHGKVVENINFNVLVIDHNALQTLGIKIKEGRNFSENFGSDSTKLIFNEAAIQVMGLKNAVGSKVNMWGKDMSIVGVVKDFHVSSFYEKIAPLVFMYNPDHTSFIMAKIAAGQEKEALKRIEKLYKQYNPGLVFEYKFLDQEYQTIYATEKSIAILSSFFAGLAILISCLGLFGLTTFNVEMRTKEIGIRKILGASMGTIMIQLSKDFIKLIFIAIAIAFPLTWWAMNKWLQGFAYRIEIHWWMFLLAGITTILIALITVSFQSVKAAISNPAKSLRTE